MGKTYRVNIFLTKQKVLDVLEFKVAGVLVLMTKTSLTHFLVRGKLVQNDKSFCPKTMLLITSVLLHNQFSVVVLLCYDNANNNKKRKFMLQLW